MTTQLTNLPSVDVGLLIRRPPHDVFEALADPSITRRFWYTKSSGRMAEGAELTWEWEMYDFQGRSGSRRLRPIDVSAARGHMSCLPTRLRRSPSRPYSLGPP
jgi:hypothetical protein